MSEIYFNIIVQYFESTDDLFLMPLFGEWDDFLKHGMNNAAFLATKSHVFGAKRVSALPEGIDFSTLTPTSLLINKGEETMIFIIFLGPMARFSLMDLLALVRFSLSEDGEIYKVIS